MKKIEMQLYREKFINLYSMDDKSLFGKELKKLKKKAAAHVTILFG